ncbi:MAG TPA: PIN domain-containing protein [Solirubrobacteraceae bacterium]|nr:PIN domain-containing protein [Solirubrobacteraceae bacterium]
MSKPDRPPRAVLDTDIIYSRVLHELLGRVANELRLLDLFWSEELLAEARSSLVAKKGLSGEVAQRWVDYLPQSFPAGYTNLDEVPTAVDLGSLTADPADHHVCALAVVSGADYLFTHDRGYLREGLRRFDVDVLAPDEFLAPALDADTRGMLDILELQASSWAGGRSIEELLAAIERAGAPSLVERARRSLSS